MAQPFKHPASGIYYLRRKVPPELRASLGREFKQSLKTREPAEAKGLFAEAWAKSEAAFASARAQLAGIEVIDRADAYQLAARWFREEQERIERAGAFAEMLVEGSRTLCERGDEAGEWVTSYLTLREAAEQDIGPPDDDWAALVAPHIATSLRQNNLPRPAPGGLAAELLNAAFLEHLHKLSEWAMQRYDGVYAALGVNVAPVLPLRSEQSKPTRPRAIKLMALFGLYAEDKTLNDGDTRATRKTLASFQATVQRFTELMGDLDVTAINREVVARYRAELARLPAKGEGTRGLNASQLIAKAEKEGLPRLSEPTIRNHIRAVSAVLSHGVRLQRLTENPIIAGGVGRSAAKAATRRVAGIRRRKDYSPDELRAIFTSPAFTETDWAPPRAAFGKAWYWLPLLLYYTGARREELAQLKASDVKKSPDGIWHLNILAAEDEEDGGRGVKTEGSRRLLPLHPDLVKRGFLDYASSLPTKGQLFPDLKPSPSGYFGANFGKRWAVYLKETVKLDSSVSPIHGFRHTFKTLSRDVGIPEDVHDAITGHAGTGGIARDYGSMPLSRMAEELAKFPLVPR
ncbi:MAG TPA: site-specific integrase [Ideonella sp.]|uniref:site-specific integrase n=1 Tax=Ideonella sp. TaxID=1929293 RepID=UPI002CF682B1|nr:site-specific integrase [Ideonella sp.]HSI52069.1 site-specific integrase [Ideonella sp.]